MTHVMNIRSPIHFRRYELLNATSGTTIVEREILELSNPHLLYFTIEVGSNTILIQIWGQLIRLYIIRRV